MDFTPRNVAKYVVKAVIHTQVQQFAKDQISDHSRFDNDDMIVKIPSHLIAWYVSDKLKPYTDRVVDTTADFIAEKREDFKNRRNTDK